MKVLHNRTGMKILGMDFASNYGDEIHGCVVFNYKGFEISASTGAIHSVQGMNTAGPTPVLVTNLSTKEEMDFYTVQDAIDHIIAL